MEYRYPSKTSTLANLNSSAADTASIASVMIVPRSPDPAHPTTGTSTSGLVHNPWGPGAAMVPCNQGHPRPMLISEVEVDEKLKRMNEAFLASLKGLGGNEGGSRSVRRRDKERARERHEEHESSIDSGGNESLQSGEEAPAPHRTPAILNLEPGSRRRHGSVSVDTGSGERPGS